MRLSGVGEIQSTNNKGSKFGSITHFVFAKNPLTHPFFILSFFLALLHQVAQVFYLSPQLFTSYLDDFLLMPVILPICTALIRFLFRQPDFRLPIFYILSAIVAVVIVFEGILPAYSSVYTRDGWDVLMYSIGAAFYAKFRF